MGTRPALHRVGTAVVGALLVACTPGPGAENGETTPEAVVADPFVSSLEVEVAGDSVRLRLHATNASNAPVELEFRTGQRYDFVVQRRGGEEVWRWSGDQMFTQALGSETVGAGETVRYAVTWPAQGERGEFIALGRVASMNHNIEQRSEFLLP